MRRYRCSLCSKRSVSWTIRVARSRPDESDVATARSRRSRHVGWSLSISKSRPRTHPCGSTAATARRNWASADEVKRADADRFAAIARPGLERHRSIDRSTPRASAGVDAEVDADSGRPRDHPQRRTAVAFFLADGRQRCRVAGSERLCHHRRVGAPPTERARRRNGSPMFLFTDIEGSTDLARKLGVDFGPLRAEHHRVLRDAIARHGGHEIDTAGDGLFVAFERAGEAVAAAVEAQRAFSDSRDPAVRMGMHSAEPYIARGRLPRSRSASCGQDLRGRSRRAAGGLECHRRRHRRGSRPRRNRAGRARRSSAEAHHRATVQRLFQLLVDGLLAEFPPLKSLDRIRRDAPGDRLAPLHRSRRLGELPTRTLGDEVRPAPRGPRLAADR